MACRIDGEPSFFAYYLRQPYLFGLGIGTVALLIVPGEWASKLVAIAVGAALTLVAGYVNYRLLIRRARRVSDDKPEHGDDDSDG